jgi:hypothetical protein
MLLVERRAEEFIWFELEPAYFHITAFFRSKERDAIGGHSQVAAF